MDIIPGTPISLGGAASKTPARLIVVGDSLSTETGYGNWYEASVLASCGRYRVVKSAGVSGNTVADVLARFSTDVTPFVSQASEIWIMIGGNDALQATPPATFITRLTQLLAQAAATGLFVRLFAIPPNNGAIDAVLVLRDVTCSLAARLNIPFCDIWSQVIDPTTGGFITADTQDGAHPNVAGYNLAKTALLASLDIPTTHNVSLPVHNVANNGLFANPLFLLDSNSDGLADGLVKSGAGTSVCTLVAGSFGNKQHLVATAQSFPLSIVGGASTIPGHTYSIKCKVTGVGTQYTWGMHVNQFDGGFNLLAQPVIFNMSADSSGEFEYQMKAVANCTQISIELGVALGVGTGYTTYTCALDWEQFQIVDMGVI